MTAAEEEPGSRTAGGCVLTLLGALVFAIAFAVSPEAGVFAIWGIGAVALWRAARRRMSDSSATPPPPSGEDVYAGHRDEIERMQEGPGEGLLILYPVREQATVAPPDARG
ncbi:hypothetical protein ABZS95_10280 [Streptomyces sp. NPDC005479]|uniref:hypothetical protein n=1 Tax=Streptomyces sp. NPDC005479 TaxID=3154879 RepID=UPI00339FFD04